LNKTDSNCRLKSFPHVALHVYEHNMERSTRSQSLFRADGTMGSMNGRKACAGLGMVPHKKNSLGRNSLRPKFLWKAGCAHTQKRRLAGLLWGIALQILSGSAGEAVGNHPGVLQDATVLCSLDHLSWIVSHKARRFKPFRRAPGKLFVNRAGLISGHDGCQTPGERTAASAGIVGVREGLGGHLDARTGRLPMAFDGGALGAS